MKTGFLYGGARIPRYVYYYYHGKIMQCRKEPWIPPYIYYDTHPAVIPPNYYYECDTMPEGATPPMTYQQNIGITVTIGGGLFDARTRYYAGYGTTSVAYYWLIHPTAKIEITASFPTLEILNPQGIWDPFWSVVTAGVYPGISGGGDVVSRREYTAWRGIYHLSNEYTSIGNPDGPPFMRPFTNSMHILFEKVLNSSTWHYYFNDEWLFDTTSPSFSRVKFLISGPSSSRGHATMDYIRVWKDTERS